MSDVEFLPDAANLDFVEQLYAEYLSDPSRVAPEWQRYFQQLGTGGAAVAKGPSVRPTSIFHGGRATVVTDDEQTALWQHRVDLLIRAYRVRGHIAARVDPLSDFVPYAPELDPQYYGFT
ncbi:MAG: 2-oxoglutarate dehydrogenase E1 component, partial [Verrucomicrobiae bacterium]|nr:2-oxoglutarate dehydrogenase E1 component [Verrucomicrobiae bacterium]